MQNATPPPGIEGRPLPFPGVTREQLAARRLAVPLQGVTREQLAALRLALPQPEAEGVFLTKDMQEKRKKEARDAKSKELALFNEWSEQQIASKAAERNKAEREETEAKERARQAHLRGLVARLTETVQFQPTAHDASEVARRSHKEQADRVAAQEIAEEEAKKRAAEEYERNRAAQNEADLRAAQRRLEEDEDRKKAERLQARYLKESDEATLDWMRSERAMILELERQKEERMRGMDALVAASSRCTLKTSPLNTAPTRPDCDKEPAPGKEALGCGAQKDKKEPAPGKEALPIGKESEKTKRQRPSRVERDAKKRAEENRQFYRHLRDHNLLVAESQIELAKLLLDGIDEEFA